MASIVKNHMLNDEFPKRIKNATSTSDGLMSAEDKARIDNLFEFGALSPATPAKDGLMSKEDKTKLDGIEEGANYYEHPDSHPATMINQDTTHKFVTETQINTWNNKANNILASEIINGLMSKEDKKKLDGIQENANNYIHPDNANTRHATDEQINRWNNKANNILVSTTINGLMSKEDKKKLDGIESNANNYIHPNTPEIRHVTDEQINRWNNIVGSIPPSSSIENGLMSAEDKKKLDGIEEGANYYEHPDSHPATMINQDTTHKFVTETQINTWNNKASTAIVTQTSNGLMSAADKKKLDGIQENANNYIHPDNANTRHVTDEQINRWNNAIGSIPPSSSIENGLMSKEDKKKLDGIEEGANKYIHPTSHPATIINQDILHKFVTETQINTWNAKASTSIATINENGLMSKEDKKKLDGIEEGANKYIHPNNANTRHVTDTQINTWNNKANNTVASSVANGLMSKEDKIKLDSFIGGSGDISLDGIIESMNNLDNRLKFVETKLQNAIFFK